MEFRTARPTDLPALKTMFRNIVEKMHQSGLVIWDETYPYEEFAGDIEKGHLHLLIQQNEIAAAFGLYETVEGTACFDWRDNRAKALYLGRIGIRATRQRQGLGTLVLKHALENAKQRNALYLRLLVSDTNTNAIAFYKKNGFIQAKGQYREFAASLNKPLVELGFEKGRP
jgi:ribosomal protein S18 acetylase RimI-like enzyme